jgi:ATP-dependent DNA ligase
VQTIIYKTLFHLDNNDNIREWFMEQDGSRYRTNSGIRGGKIVTSDWKQASAKNVGKTNATTDEAQATAEIEAIYQKKLDRKYSLTADTAQRSNFLQPMLAATYDEAKTLKKKKRWYSQPKLDGLRCVMDDSGGTSRAGKPFHTVAHLVDELETASEKYNVTFDGELYNHGLKHDFEKIVSLVKKQKLSSLTEEELVEIAAKVEFHIYDVIFWDDLERRYEDRLSFLTEIFDEDFADVVMLKFVPAKLHDNLTHEEAVAEHDYWFERGYEGLMLRDADAPYENKRSKGLVKFKDFDEAEFKIVGFVEGQGNWAGALKAVEVEVPSGTSEAGVAGPYELNAQRLIEAEEYLGGDATIKHKGWTKDGKLRHGVAKALHKGKRDY